MVSFTLNEDGTCTGMRYLNENDSYITDCVWETTGSELTLTFLVKSDVDPAPKTEYNKITGELSNNNQTWDVNGVIYNRQ